MAKFEKNQFFEISRAKISKMKEKIKIPASTSFSYYYIYLEIGPNFKKLHLERVQSYLYSVKSNDSI